MERETRFELATCSLLMRLASRQSAGGFLGLRGP
jgi:hypothetical protein